MDTKVVWKDGMSFTGSAESGFTLPLGADPAAGGANDGFRPIELLGVGLAGCTAMDVISILKKKQQQVTAFEVRVHADRAEQHPKVFTRLVVTYLVTGRGVDEAALLRAIELTSTKYCPAQAMFSRIAPMELKYEIYEDDGGLVKSGDFAPR